MASFNCELVTIEDNAIARFWHISLFFTCATAAIEMHQHKQRF